MISKFFWNMVDENRVSVVSDKIENLSIFFHIKKA